MNKSNQKKLQQSQDDKIAANNNIATSTPISTDETQEVSDQNNNPTNSSTFSTSSQTRSNFDNDTASENDSYKKPVRPLTAPYERNASTQALGDHGNNKKYVTSNSPSVDGESSASGDTPDTESASNMLENAQYMGQQANEDDEHPQEIDIARDIDEAEEYIRTH